MSANYNSGKSTFIGWGLPTDPGDLDPTKYEGAVIYNGLDQILYYSNGDEWTQPLNAPIRKPYALEPTNSAQQSQLRLSQFLTGTGFEDKYRQIAVMFEVYTSPDMTEESRVRLPVNPTDIEDAWVFPLTFGIPPEYTEPNNDYIEDDAQGVPYRHLRSSYQLPKELFEPEAKFYWRAKYIANDGQESLFSDLYRQTYPPIIDQPYSLRQSGLITDKAEISPFVSAFGRTHSTTSWTFYENEPSVQIIDGERVETPVGSPVWTRVTEFNEFDPNYNPYRINILEVETDIMEPGKTYYWRAQHFDNDGSVSDWSFFSSFTRPETNVVKVIFDTRIGTGSFVQLYLGGSNIVVDWGDGEATTGTSGQAVFQHTYDITEPQEYTVTISGNVTHYSHGDDAGQIPVPVDVREKLTKVKSFGNVGYFRVSGAINLIEVPDYLPASITSFRAMFSGCTKFNQNLNLWDTKNIVDMQSMFSGATSFNGDISTWVTTKVGAITPRTLGESFNSMFSGASAFNQNLNYKETYDYHGTGTVAIVYWDTSNSPSMASMFKNARAFNGDIRSWKLNSCNSTASMFEGAVAFNNDLSRWDFSQVLDVSRMFYGAINFNRNIGTGDFSFVKDFSNMFTNASNFNRDISHWKISTRTGDEIKMTGMFQGARNFNSVIDYNIENGTWNVSRVVDMSNMFRDCLYYNQPLTNWNTANVKNTSYMFYNARTFNQPLTSWNMAKVENASYMFYQALKFNQDLVWDLSKATDLSWMFALTDTFNSNVRFKLCVDPTKNVNLFGMFYYARLFNKTLRYDVDGDGAWDMSRVNNTGYMFLNARAFDQDIGNWNTSSITYAHAMFYSAIAFNQNIGSWDVSKITDMSYMFFDANRFNNGGSDSIKNWVTSAATNMSGMFWAARAFNQPIGSWDVSKVYYFGNMFRDMTIFNQPLNTWDTSRAVSFNAMFYYSPAFNQPLSNWNTKNVTDMGYMFAGAKAFNQPLTTNGDKWNTANVTSMYSMFSSTDAFNQNLSSWNTGNVTNMGFMFWYARAFTNAGQSLNTWNTSKVVYMHYMFGGSKFNSSISSWNTAKVEYMYYMFYDSPFNQPINTNGDSWNVSKVRNMTYMFGYNNAFNQNISGWNTSEVTDMSYMFIGGPFNQPIGSWNTAKVVYMNGMFYNTNFDQDISSWNVSKVAYMRDMFRGSRNNVTTKLSTVNYDKLLSLSTGWPSRTVIPGVVFHAGASKYSSTNADVINGRSALINKPNLWTITDGGSV